VCVQPLKVKRNDISILMNTKEKNVDKSTWVRTEDMHLTFIPKFYFHMQVFHRFW
jgi:hypothetical protein